MPDKQNEDQLTGLVRKLRLALGDTQQQFASRLGLAIATVVRYEHNRPPKAKALARLEQVACEKGLEEYAAAFRRALNMDLGAGSRSGLSHGRFGVLTADESDLLEAFE